MVDYPDYTDAMQIIGSDIMIPIDLQAAYIMMPVDIQAQYVNVDIDIVAQTIGNIDINLAASDITVNIDIAAQTIGDLTISIDAQTVAIIDQPNWAAINSTDKNFVATASNIASASTTYGAYTVPAGKTLYICGMTFVIKGYAAANRDLNQMGYAWLRNQTDGVELALQGGNGGGGVVFSKPIPVAANKEFRYYVSNYANHNCDIYITVWGYEL